MSFKSPIAFRQEILSVIEQTPDENLIELLQLVRDFHQKNIVEPTAKLVQSDTSQLQWQQAVNEIESQDKASSDRKKANISQLISALNEDDDIEEQQQTLAIISSLEGVSI